MRRELDQGRIEVAGAVLLTASFVVLLPMTEAAPSASRFYIGWFGAWAGLVLSIWPCRSWVWVGARTASASQPPSRPASRRTRVLLWFALAALLRLLAVGFEPALSDDVYRYAWDGRVVLAGGDPYATSPDDEELLSLRDALWERTAHREVESVYPPLAQAAFATAAWFERPILALRLLWLGFDLATCWLLFGLARRCAGSERAALLYAWNPLVVVEGVGMGHVDVFGVFWLVLALHLGVQAADAHGRPTAPRRRWAAAGAGVALAAGALVKLVPLLLIPVWAVVLRSRRLAVAAATALVVGSAPIWLGVGFPPGLLRYGISWEFNGLLFEPLWRLLEAGGAAERVKELLVWAQNTFGLDPEPLYPFVYPQFLAKMMLGLVLLLVLAMILLLARDRGLRRDRTVVLLPLATVSTLVAATAVSATLYPWYLIWLASLLPLAPSVSLLALCVCMGFAYLPALVGAQSFPTTWALVWLPALCLAFGEVWWRRRRTDL